MSRFAIRNPYFLIVLCLVITVVGVTALARMPVDLFPAINIPVVVVATFYNGMPPEQIEVDITGRFERFFTLASNIDHIESRSLPGVSLIKVFFQPGTDADSAVTNISNLAMANLRRLPPGTLPPVVLKFDASSLPVCLITLKGEGLDETALRDTAQYAVRNQVAGVPGASVPQPFGGRYRQIMVYVDPYKLEAHRLSPMDVTRAVNDSNLILPAGDVRIGPLDYSLYTNSQADTVGDINLIPLKTIGNAAVRVQDVGEAKDAQQIQLNVVRVDGQRSVYLPVLKQGGDTNTIQVVDGIKSAVDNLVDVPDSLKAEVVFDQSEFVKKAIRNLMHEGGIGLFLTSLMILVFLGSMRATTAVLLSIPLSALATFILLYFGGNSINSMVLGGLALAFSRLIDNSVVVLENIYRHLEMGQSPREAAERGGSEVALPVLAATLTTAIVFFPVTFLYGVSKFLFTALAAAVVISLFASYFVAMTVVPLFAARFLKAHSHKHEPPRSIGARFNRGFNKGFERMLQFYAGAVRRALVRPALTVAVVLIISASAFLLYPVLSVAFFPRTDAGQFVINVNAPSGTRLELTEAEVDGIENLIRRTIPKDELAMIVSNVGVTPGFSSIYTSNSAQHTATIQVSLAAKRTASSQEYMDRVRARIGMEFPQITTYFQSGGLVDAVLNLGLPAPIDVQVSGSDLHESHNIAKLLSSRIRRIRGVSDVYTPQDVDYPALRLTIDRERAGMLGLTQKEVVQNIITSLTSNQMIAPSYWVDPKSGNDYMLTVQYPENQVKTLSDLRGIPLRGSNRTEATRLDAVTELRKITAPTEVDHYQLRRTIDVYVGLTGEDLGRVSREIERVIRSVDLPKGVRVDLRGMVQAMRSSFLSFGIGLLLALLLLYLILVAQFRSFVDPILILLAVPTGLAGVLVTLVLTGTSLNVMSLMGVVMMAGIVVSNSILIVDFAHHVRRHDGRSAGEAAIAAARTRLRPILMTSLATIIGLLPMALKLGEGSESYAPLARAIMGGLTVSLVFTVFVVPAAYALVYGRPRNLGPQAHAALIAFVALLVVFTPASAQTTPVRMTLADAEQMALRRNPQIEAARSQALATEQLYPQVRSAYYPTLSGSVTGVGAPSDTRIGAGGINNPAIYSRFASGITLSQLITDFGRTSALAESARLRANADFRTVEANRRDVLLGVNRAYLAGLRAQAIMHVAEQTIEARQLLVDQARALAASHLKSELDVRFAEVNLAEARLLLETAQNDRHAADAELSLYLGYPRSQQFELVDQPSTELPGTEADGLIAIALAKRPELEARRFELEASQKTVEAEKRLRWPSVSAVASFGAIPGHTEQMVNGNYAAAGVNISLPFLNGGLYAARQKEAEFRAAAVRQQFTQLSNEISRNVSVALLNAVSASDRMWLSKQLFEQASLALELAQSRYDLGLSSIVELSQAQLAKTSAEIQTTTARYDYQLRRRILAYETGDTF